MKTNKTWGILGLLAISFLTACGGGSDPTLVAPSTIAGAGFNSCGATSLPLGQKSSTVVGNLNNGAKLTLDLYLQPDASVGAIGEIYIPSTASLFGAVLSGTGVPVGTSEFRTCVTTPSPGVMQQGGAYDYLEMALRGANVYIELGSNYGISTYVVNNYLEGAMLIEIPNVTQGQALLYMARP